MCSPGLCILRIECELFTVLNYCVTTLSGVCFFFIFFLPMVRSPIDVFRVDVV